MAQITLYKNQSKLVGKTLKQFKKGHKSVLVQSPTGSGKTVMFSYIAQQAAKKNKKVLIITNRTELLTQAGGTLSKFDLQPYLIQAGTKYLDKRKQVFVAMSQTLRNRLKQQMWFDFIKNSIDLIIIDEAHIQDFNHIFLQEELIKSCFVIGFTATPARSGKMRQLAMDYERLVCGEQIKKLIKKEKLVNTDIYDCGAPDLTGVKMNSLSGDYSETSMFRKFDSPKLYEGLVKNYKRICDGQKMIVFCVNVSHAIKTVKSLNKAGVSAKFLSSKIGAPKEPRRWTQANEVIYNEKREAYKLYCKNFDKYSGDRKEIIDGFAKGEFTVLVNVDMLTTGFDDPTIQVVALCRATTSLTLYLQMLGRGARISPSTGKTHFITLDFGGNKSRFGGYDIDRDWSLWHEKSEGGGVAPMKVCGEDSKLKKIEGAGKVKQGCERLILAAYKICPFCGFKYPEKNPAQEAELQLAAITDKKGVSLKVKPFSEMTFEELTKYREIKKHSMHWLYRMLYKRDKQKTIKEYAAKYKWKSYRTKKVLEICRNFG